MLILPANVLATIHPNSMGGEVATLKGANAKQGGKNNAELTRRASSGGFQRPG